jgi:hypothetical protein
MLIEVSETHPAAPGKKVATVVAAGGQKFDIWPENLASIRVGGRYEIEVADREYNGRTFRKITKATPVNGAAPTNGHANGTAKPATNGSAPPGPSTTDGEAEFVGRVLHALILKGEVAYTKKQLYDATELLRGLWGATFGGRSNGNGGGHGGNA